MSAEQDERREWRLLWLSSMQAFADSYTQMTRWPAATKAKPRFSFVGCMSGYFDEAYLREPDAYNTRLAAGQVSSAEVAAVSRFHSLAESYESPTEDDWNSEAILRDPKWQEVVAAAQDAQQRLLSLLTDETEKDALTKPRYGRELVDTSDAELPSTSGVSSGPTTRPSMFENLRHGEFLLRKPISPRTVQTPADVRRQLAPLGFRAQKVEGGVTYRIGYFALSHSQSMFAPFTEVRLRQEAGLWVLRLKVNKLTWPGPLILFAVMLAEMRQLGLTGVPAVLVGLAVPTVLFGASFLLVALRLSRWWNRL